MTTLTVTATQGGGTFQGLLLRVKVLTGAAPAASQAGAAATQSGNATHSAAIVTTAAGSVVYGALTADATSFTAEPLCTLIDNFHDTTNAEAYGSFRTTSPTGTPGSTLIGASAPSSLGGMAAAEILAAGTITEDASAPAVATTMTATTLASASFTPVAGSLLVAMIGSDGSGAAITTMAVSGGGLTWTPLAEAHAAADEYAGVWIADVPGGAVARHPAWMRTFFPGTGEDVPLDDGAYAR